MGILTCEEKMGNGSDVAEKHQSPDAARAGILTNSATATQLSSGCKPYAKQL
jgi:hypothetical protein